MLADFGGCGGADFGLALRCDGGGVEGHLGVNRRVGGMVGSGVVVVSVVVWRGGGCCGSGFQVRGFGGMYGCDRLEAACCSSRLAASSCIPRRWWMSCSRRHCNGCGFGVTSTATSFGSGAGVGGMR